MPDSSVLADRLAATSHANGAELLRRKPRRVTITLNWQTFRRLQERADEEGRSLSNLSAFLLEQGVN